MDSKQRHEREQNELAKLLRGQYEGWIKPNSSWLGWAILAVVIVVVVIMGTARLTAYNNAMAWKQFHAAFNSVNAEEDLELIAQSTSGEIAALARLTLAQRQLSEGSAQVFIDKNKAIGILEKAMTMFRQVQQSTNIPVILQQAGYGLGQSFESLAAARDGDDLARALDEYQHVADRWGESFWGKLAQRQAAFLQKPSTQMFLAQTAQKTAEVPEGMEGFNVSIDRDDPFAPGQIDWSSLYPDPSPSPAEATPAAQDTQIPAQTSPEDSETNPDDGGQTEETAAEENEAVGEDSEEENETKTDEPEISGAESESTE